MSESIQELTRLLKDSVEKIATLSKAAKLETGLKEDYQYRLIALMDAIGTNTNKNDLGNFRVLKTDMPQAADWEVVHKYVRDNNAFHLLQRRLSPVAYKEMIEAGEVIPGIDVYEKQTISIRKS